LRTTSRRRHPPNSGAAIIDKLPGVKKEEVQWSGVKEWLAEQKGPVTREALLAHLRENEVQIKEVTKGGKSKDETVPDEQAGKDHAVAWDGLNEKIAALETKQDFTKYPDGLPMPDLTTSGPES